MNSEYFIVANSNAAPFVSDQTFAFTVAVSPHAALDKHRRGYTHPAGLFASRCYANANSYHKGAAPLAEYMSDKALALRGDQEVAHA